MSGCLSVLIGDNASSSASYTGPGDLTNFGSAKIWYGLRAYKASYIGGNCIRLMDQASGNATTFTILPSGFVDVAGINIWITAHSVTTILVNTLYDQSGSGLNMVAVAGHEPIIPISAGAVALSAGPGGAFPTIRFASGSSQYLRNTTGITQAQPFMVSWVASHTGAISSLQQVIAANGSSIRSGWGSADKTVMMSDGTAVTVSVSANDTFYAVQQNFNGGSSNSDIMVDGSRTALSLSGTNGFTTGNMDIGDNTFGSGTLDGNVMEVGMWAGNIASGDETAMNGNQHGTSGYNW